MRRTGVSAAWQDAAQIMPCVNVASVRCSKPLIRQLAAATLLHWYQAQNMHAFPVAV
jgi:hypothetical protein